MVKNSHFSWRHSFINLLGTHWRDRWVGGVQDIGLCPKCSSFFPGAPPLYISFARTDVSLFSIKTFSLPLLNPAPSSVRKCKGELESFYLKTCLKLQSCCRKAASFRKLLSKQRPKGLFVVEKGQLLFHMHAQSQRTWWWCKVSWSKKKTIKYSNIPNIPMIKCDFSNV